VDLHVIRETAEANALWIIEDAAEAHGALYRGRRVGALGQVGCFSFYPNKIITTGEGGMCVTSDPQLAEQMRRGRDHGMSKDRPYWHEQVGANYRMTNLQAAIGLAQLEKVDRFIRAKRRIAALYQELLGSPPELGLHLSAEAPWAFSVYWMNNVILPLGVDRDEVMRSLARSRIESRPFFHPLHSMPAFRSCPRSDAVVSVEEFPLRGISLPSGADLDERRVERVASVLTAAVQRQRSRVRRPT